MRTDDDRNDLHNDADDESYVDASLHGHCVTHKANTAVVAATPVRAIDRTSL